MKKIIQEYAKLHKEEISAMKKQRAKEAQKIREINRKEYHKKYYEKNKEYINEHQKEYYKNNKEHVSEYRKMWQQNLSQEKKDEINRKQKERRAALGDEARKQYLDYYYKNREKINERRRKKK